MLDRALDRDPTVKFMVQRMAEVRGKGVRAPAHGPSVPSHHHLINLNLPTLPLHSSTCQAGCTIGRAFFRVEACTEDVGGGFRPPDGVVLCHNHLPSQGDVNRALVHELVHAYDHCRAASLEWGDCAHHACSEVRAAILSGDCTFRQEQARGNYTLRGGARACARRRAALSVGMNPACGGPGAAAAAVDAVFDRCYADTAPFDRIP